MQVAQASGYLGGENDLAGLERVSWRHQTWIFVIVLIAPPTASVAGTLVGVGALLVIGVLGALLFGYAITAILLPIRRWRLSRQGARQILWGHNAQQLAALHLKRRADGAYVAFDFVSTGAGAGAVLVRLGTGLADDLNAPIALTTTGPKLVRYYQSLGFTQTRGTRALLITRMSYRPKDSRATRAGHSPAT